jgi:anti-anti-sigma factor
MPMKGTDMEIRIEETGANRIIHISGQLLLNTAADLQAVLLDNLHPSAKTVVNGSGIEAVDLCGLQLLCSAHRTYVMHDAGFEVEAASEELKKIARAAGYAASKSVCPYRQKGNCLWKW